MWQQWTNAFLGLAVMLAPFLGLGGDLSVWAFAILGIAIAALAVWGAIEHERMNERFSEMAT